MRIQDAIRIIQDNFYIAFILVAILAVILGIIYFIIYKKALNGEKNLSKGRVFIWFCFIGYIIMVIGVTFIGRGARLYGDSNLHFLSTYRGAWNSFNSIDWLQIILNIIMLVPFGILLPLINKRFYKFKWTFGAASLLTLTIETMQLLTGYGVFDLDDIFNNMVGALIGHGIVMAIISFVEAKKNRTKSFKRSAIYLIPLIMVIILSISIVGAYNAKEFGNLFIAYNYKLDMKYIDLSLNTEISNDNKEIYLNDNNKYSIEEAPIYKAETYNINTGEDFFRSFLKEKNIEEDLRVDSYGDMAIYRSDGNPGYHMWFYFNDGSYDYTDFSSFDEGIARIDTDKETVLERLAEFDISVPKSAVFSKPGDSHELGTFQWTIENYVEGDYLTNGVLSVQYYNDDSLKSIANNIVKYKKLKNVRIKSKEEIYNDIEEGKFKFHYNSEKIEKLDIEDMKLGYLLDTKGYYQPIYSVDVKLNGKEDLLLMPAL
ncbi:MAG: VanZ family protein [Tissierella sp.]|uniref:VanZ family protein n=1 Tax=Tissierella sp. TaxID=41274 RepID=UPI003F97545C